MGAGTLRCRGALSGQRSERWGAGAQEVLSVFANMAAETEQLLNSIKRSGLLPARGMSQ